MKKIGLILFAVFCLAICLFPSVGMIFHPTTEPIGNERQSQAPSVTDKDGGFNFNYFTELGSYAEKHIAFRPEMIQADAAIQSGVFRTSNVDSVLVGNDGWLYYSSASDDYLGRNPLSQREINGVVHNLTMIESYAKAHGADFLFTVAPNKNTLYPEHMPYTYAAKVSDVHNRDLLNNALARTNVSYCNLFEPLMAQDETLYFARDSHWNNKGALLAYNTLLDRLGKAHDDYSGAEAVRKKDFVGDLSKMLYPNGSEAEYNIDYGAQERYSYVTDTKSVEDALIQTQNQQETGALYMYRDSFGNALVPFFASAYQNAAFTKAFPMNLREDFETYHPDTFIMELVERNISWLIEKPPMLPAPEISIYRTEGSLENQAKVTAEKCLFAAEYTEVSGIVDSASLDENAVYYITVERDGVSKTFEAFHYKDENGDGFKAYLPSADYPADSLDSITVIVQNKGAYYTLRS